MKIVTLYVTNNTNDHKRFYKKKIVACQTNFPSITYLSKLMKLNRVGSDIIFINLQEKICKCRFQFQVELLPFDALLYQTRDLATCGNEHMTTSSMSFNGDSAVCEECKYNTSYSLVSHLKHHSKMFSRYNSLFCRLSRGELQKKDPGCM